MDLRKRLELVTRNTCEIVTEAEIRTLLETDSNPKAYWGFEPSGLMHIGIGAVCSRKIKDLLSAQFEVTVLLADWHAWINNKLGGNMDNIRMCGEYFKQCFKGLGIPPEKVRYLWTSDLAKEVGYWEKVINIAKSASLSRVLRALPVMGRQMNPDDVDSAAVYYPSMQAADIFQLGIQVACAGIDQRKAHMLARDSAKKLSAEKPICLHTPLLPGLSGTKRRIRARFDESDDLNTTIGAKMSKSIPGDCVFVHDEADAIRTKIRSAYCPPDEIEHNPVLQICKEIIIPELGRLEIERPKEKGGTMIVESYRELVEAYVKREVHPLDLKNYVGEALVKILEGVRREFEAQPELLEKIKQLEITR